MTPTEKHRQTAVFIASYETELSVGRYKKLADKIARALADAEREGMKRAARELIDAWEELPDGDHDIDTANAWFASSLFPVLERFKTILSEAGEA